MSERIKEFILQAGFSVVDLHHQGDDFQKFAELIVAECIVDFYRRYLDINSDEDITVQVKKYVKEHFGVEE